VPAQKRSRKNYIGILDDRIEELRAADPPARYDRRVKDYFLGLITAVLNRSDVAG
jgi:hypothetical protein